MKKRSILVIFWLLLGVMIAMPAWAQSEFGTNTMANLATYSTRSITDTIVGIVNIILGFLGVIAVLMFLYAGWLWLSSRGDAQKIQKSKMIMASTVIGLLIIFASYAIANFVIVRLAEETGVVNSTPGGTLPPGNVTCDPPAVAGDMHICSIYPAGSGPGNYLTITGWNFGAYDLGNPANTQASLLLNNSGEVVLDLVTCTGVPIWRELYAVGGNHFYEIRAIVPDVAIELYDVRVNNLNIPDSDQEDDAFSVTAGSVGLNIACLTPSSGPEGLLQVKAEGINFGAVAGTITMPGWLSGAETNINVNLSAVANPWTDNLITFDIPTNALAGNITITNSGNTSSNSSYFSVSCGDNSQCDSVCCSVNECRPNTNQFCPSGVNVVSGPYINSINPDDGAPGNLVTIFGQNFGNNPGEVWFSGSAGPIEGIAPADLNAVCPANYWYDNYIVIGVPDTVGPNTLISGSVSIVTADGDPSLNSVSFERNSISRPGLCLLNPIAGRFEDQTVVTASGINFQDSEQMLYSNIPGYDFNIISDNEANSIIPNLQDGNIGIQIEEDDEYSNPLPFDVDSSLVGEPFIETWEPSIPSERGGYMTIRGRNFGDNPGHVYFHRAGAPVDQEIYEASYDFPSMCRDNYWSNNQITVKVSGLPAAYHSWNTYVTRTDGRESNRIDHNTNDQYPGAGLCAIFPDNAPNNYQGINFYGEYFGTTFGAIDFEGSAAFTPTPPAVWNDLQVLNVTVPADASSGPVFVNRLDGNPDSSNSLYFNVSSCSNDGDCPLGRICCEGNLGNYCAVSCDNITSCGPYSYTLTTQNNPFGIKYNYDCSYDWQSPTPWPDDLLLYNSEDVFVTANLSLSFTKNVVDADLNNNISLHQCTNEDCTAYVGLPLVFTMTILPDGYGEKIIIDPQNPLLADQWYKVALDGDFRAQDSNETWNIIDDNNLYNVGGWTFKTRPNDLACEVSSIQVTPQSPWADFYLGNTRDFYAAPTANNCNICSDSYIWNWNTVGTNAGAATPSPLSNPGNIGHTVLNANYATQPLSPNYVELQCSMTQGAITHIATSTPVILAPVLLVENFGPICDDSCQNAEVWVDFNTQVVGGDIITGNFIIQDCLFDASCSAPQPANLTSSVAQDGNWRVVLEHNNNFTSNHYYRVSVDSSIRNIHGYTLGSNAFYGADHFIFRAGSANCIVASTAIAPSSFSTPEDTSVVYGATAYSEPNLCYPGGQPIQCTGSCQWSWQESDIIVTTPPVATIPNSTDAINTAYADNEGTASIIATANQTGTDFSSTGILTVTTTTGPGSVSHGAPLVFDEVPPNEAVDICPNAGVMMRFTELMDPDSVRANVAIYGIPAQFPDTDGDGDVDTQDIPAIYQGIDWLERIDANYIITYEDSADPGIEPDQTLVVINPNNLLRSNSWHRVLVRGSVASIYGVSLSSTQYNFDVDDNTVDDSYTWTFTTNNDTCRVSYLLPIPNSDWFFCGGNNCTGDRNEPEAGNQHDYFALPMDVRGVYLNWDLFNYDWSLDSDGTDLLFNNDGTVANSNIPNPQFKVGDRNGVETLIVSVDGINPSMGSASASIGINIFLCELPWPSMATFPWQDNLFNFSTYYCVDQDQDDGVAALPTLGEPLENFNPNLPPNVQREYVLPVFYPTAMLENNFGSLASGLLDQTGNWWSNLFAKISRPWQTPMARGQSIGTDIIAVRVMENLDHLSVADWFKEYAPNPNAQGTELEVDGYPAIQVGNTVYVSAFNINDAETSMYTNIYILTYNIGAREATVEIFNQLLDNFKLNININQQNNICANGPAHELGKSCSSDFDCTDHNCQSKGLKLRRDLVRLGDLLNMSSNLADYGNTHTSCANNSLIACTYDADCDASSCDQCASNSPCVFYYPLLNAGTFVRGQSNSSWPSWQQTLAPNFNTSLALDPINLFNGCTGPGYEAYDPNTCWNEEDLLFSCPFGSLIYHYLRNDTGTNYTLAANFESLVDFSILHSSLDSRIHTTLDACTSASANMINPQCGNGRIDPDRCSDPNFTDPAACVAGGGQWLHEECDGGFQDNQCNPILSGTYGVHTWWNEQRTGCYPAGSMAGGNLVECTWYEPDIATMYNLCGGYCGNNALETAYENCENINGIPNYGGIDFSCPNGDDELNCSNTSCQAVCGAAETPAAACGDGVWTPSVEQCDISASPNGLAGQDCTLNGNISCNNNCEVMCDVGVAYTGHCGNAIQEGLEACDYASYVTPIPNLSSAGNPYTCQTDCTLGADYCNDTILQGNFDEVCDTNLAISPTPPNSGRYAQYGCRTVDGTVGPMADARWTKCTPTDGGWCGDGVVTSTYGEICDSAYHPTPAQSSSTNTYSCSLNCYDRLGGWCGDGIAQDGNNGNPNYGETCDYADYTPPLPRFTSSTRQYICSNVCLADSGGYCGNNIIEDGTGGTFDGNEVCELATYARPGIGESSSNRQYTCEYCDVAGGYCGDGVIPNPMSYNICATIVAGNWVNYGINMTDPACTAVGGTNRPIEQCDLGLDVQKKADLVFVFDISGSMKTIASDLCTSMNQVINTLDDSEIEYRITIMPLGDEKILTPSDYSDDINGADNANDGSIGELFYDQGQSGAVDGVTLRWSEHAIDVLENLTTNCNIYTSPASYPNVRYRSYYSVNNNDINDDTAGLRRGIGGAWGSSQCNDGLPGGDQFAGNIENWGPAIAKISADYNWTPSYQKIVVPVSQDYAWCGNGYTTIPPILPILNPEEDNAGAGDILVEAVSVAVGSDVIISPILFGGNYDPDSTVGYGDASEIAEATGGLFTNQTPDDPFIWANMILQAINASFCDGNGDGDMDCQFPSGGAVVASLPGLSIPSYILARDSSAGSDTVTVTLLGTATAWSAVSNDPSWITVSRAGNILTFSVSANTGAARTGSIKLTATSDTGTSSAVTLTINQAAPVAPSVTLAPSTISRDSSAATLNTSVTLGGSATTWTAATTFSAWITGLNQVGNNLYFNLAANTGPDRVGTIVVTASSLTGSTATATLTINQAAPVIPPDTTPPTDPGNTLVATAADGQVRLDWAASTDDSGTVIYQVERISPNPFTYTAYSNTFTNTSLTNGLTYTYRVRARDLVPNSSNYSNTVSAVPVPAAIPPQAPINITATPQAAGVYLTWGIAATGDPISYFRLERSTNFSFSSFTVVSDINFASFTGSYTDAFPLSNPTVTYYYRVKSVNSGSGLESVYAGPVNATIPDTTAPTPPTNLVSTYLSDTQYRFSWTASTDNIAVDHYEVEYQADAFVSDGTGANIGNPTTNSMDFILDPTVTTYSFRVRAVDTGGNYSAWSSALVAFAVDVLPPTAPTNLTAVVSSNNVNLSWTVSSDNVGVSGYDLYRATVSGGPYTLIPCSSTSLTCLITGTNSRRNISVPSGIYYYVVQAYDAAGNRSNNSNEAGVNMDSGAPTVPTGLNLQEVIFPGPPVSVGITLTWLPSTDLEGNAITYEIYFRIIGGGAAVVATGLTDLTYSRPGLTPGASYSYQVRARDSNNNVSAWSNAIQITLSP